jgi:GNAT superfamily N-acetyltransferase
VTLTRTTLEAALAADADLEQALRDAIERGYDGPLPEPPPEAKCYLVRADGAPAGLLCAERERPEASAATIAVTIAPDRRGRDLGARAVFVAERRLRRDGARRFYARAPRTNGRGLYFWLRAGYAPLRAVLDVPDADGGATWFRLPEHLARPRGC